MIVDAHVHVGAWNHADFLGRACTVADAAKVFDEAGVGGALILPTDRCDNAGLLEQLRTVDTSMSFWFVPWLRPVTDGSPGRDDLDFVDQNIESITGLKIHPSLSRLRITDPTFEPALEVAAAHDLVVVVHCGRWQEIASYKFAIDAAAAHPKVRFLLAHAGGDTPPLSTAAAEMLAERKLDNVWFDFSGVREFWVIERNVARLSADRYLMGSDYNLAHPNMYIGAVRGMALPQADKDKILAGNALSLFGPPLARQAT